MFNNNITYDRWGNPTSTEPPAETVSPPTATWLLGQGNTGQPPISSPPPYGPSRSDYPPPPSFPIELPPPSPQSRPIGGTFGFSASVRFRPPGSGNPSLPPGFSSPSPSGELPPARHVPSPNSTAAAPTHPTNPSDTGKRYASPIFTRPICNTCHVNCVNVRESNTNFCERCFQDALRRRGKKDSPKANRPTCRICHVNYINVREVEMIYCERCWQETLKKRGIREDGSVWP